MPHKGNAKDVFADQEVQITYRRSKTGRLRSIPVWFTVKDRKMELLPMYGLRTKWFVDVEKSGSLALSIGPWKKESRPTVVRDLRVVEQVKQRFSEKYGEGEVKKYYPSQDVALEVPL